MNFTYTTNPGYLDLVCGMYKAIRWHYRAENWNNYTFPAGFIEDFKKYYKFPIEEAYLILVIAVVFTLFRYAFEAAFCKPFISWLRIDSKSDRMKFPESLWKLIIYTILWSYCCYLLIFSGKYDYFIEPWHIWDDWEIGMKVPDPIKWLYFVQCGFYLHSIYGTLYMDTKRKDFAAMLIHHILTITLIFVSYATRYHKIGLLVLFMHDVCDILLEFTKCNVYLKNRGGKFYSYNEKISNIGFGSFTLVWYLFRLYWFPLKVLYSSGVVAAHRAYHRGAGLYAFFNSLLWILLGLNIYWFYFILLFLYKVASGQMSEINDTRDFEEDAKVEAKKEK